MFLKNAPKEALIAFRASAHTHTWLLPVQGRECTWCEHPADRNRSNQTKLRGAPIIRRDVFGHMRSLYSPVMNESLLMQCVTLGEPRPLIKWTRFTQYVLVSRSSTYQTHRRITTKVIIRSIKYVRGQRGLLMESY